jgi:hypothetical protein
MKPKKILILGMDGDIGYHYTASKKNRPLTYLPLLMESTIPQIDHCGIKVINGSYNSNITAYPRHFINDALDEFSE